jgi:hypothetical protein
MAPIPPAVYSTTFLSHLIVNIASPHHRLRLIAPGALRIQPALNSALAIAQDLRITSLYSKWPFSLDGFGLITAIKPRI